jgi:hypothetical protein
MGVSAISMIGDLVQDLWNNVLALPEKNAAGLIRYAVSDL